ncbi:glucosaminidase domain-containing protein [Dictyobacter aurantiacus]|uniref:Mannosyl-glycoprotein endo-beta-N-acetylglucosamidase-like domain-containing protein n=1 Tax=Dictyobacter aurantiacus TaxID=1936993 RepID=A0A401ZA92_9CHLR|nr:glucosaminidase domain-containing protein [Dictyobacter aurantiacus]GCE03790.1 hypothetical protein KDAU_11190 [Dictyobacter aurantiacus]
MPKVKRRVYRATYRKKRPRMTFSSAFRFSVVVVACVAIGIGIISMLVSTLTPRLASRLNGSAGPYNVMGKPTISADFINEVLAHYHSPAQNKGQALYDEGVKYNIDPAYALAFFMQESQLGTQGVASVTHSLGNIRATPGHPSYDGYRKYDSWEEGFEDWYQLISKQYIQNWGLTTVDQIIPVYAPNSDNNNEQQYINSVEYMVDRWRNGSIEIS